MDAKKKVQFAMISTAILLGVVLGLVVGTQLSDFPTGIPIDDDTKPYQALDLCGGGGFPDPGKIGERTVGEVTSRDKTYLSWRNDGTSIPLSVSGTSYKCIAGFGGVPVKHRYQFDINNGDGFTSMRQDDFPYGFIEIDGGDFYYSTPHIVSVREISIDGTSYEASDGTELPIQHGAVMRVTFVLGTKQAGGFGGCCDWYSLSSDETRLVYGTPTITAGADLYEVGETGNFRWTIPFVDVDARPAYFLTLTNENTGQPVGGWNYRQLTARDGVATFAVTADLFSDSPGAANRVRGRIYSPVFLADVTDVAVIDDKDLAPRIVSASFNQREFREGDAVKIEYRAEPNPTTKEPIVRYHVLAAIGGDILYDQDTTSTSISFTASRTGVLDAEITAYDAKNRPSAVYRLQATIGNVVIDCEAYPDLPQCNTFTADFTFVIGLLAVAVVTLITMAVASGAAGAVKTGRSKLLVYLIAGAVILVAVIAIAAAGLLEPYVGSLTG